MMSGMNMNDIGKECFDRPIGWIIGFYTIGAISLLALVLAVIHTLA